MTERGVSVDHSTIQRWVVRYSPELEAEFRRGKRTVGARWRMDETYIKVKGTWKSLYRAVDKEGKTSRFPFDCQAGHDSSLSLLAQGSALVARSRETTMDKSGANKAAADAFGKDVPGKGKLIEIRQVKYLNNIVEQDHRGVKRRTGPMLGFKSFRSAQRTLAGIELVHMLRKNQHEKSSRMSPAELLYSLAG